MKLAVMSLVLISVCTAFGADANESSGEMTRVVVSERTVQVPVQIDATNVKFSRADYSSSVVKVLVPGLADVTVMDHRNLGEGAPCLATYQARRPSEVIRNHEAIESIAMKITLTKLLYLNDKNECQVVLEESILADIRGFKFVHERSEQMPSRVPEDCR